MIDQVELRGSTIRFIDQGTDTSGIPPLMLVHGFPLDRSMWKYQIELLSKKTRVLCPDLPGFGHSITLQTISMRQMADDLANLLDRLKIDQVIFCGLSMGGYIGWEFWHRHCARLSGLIACDTRSQSDTDVVARARRVSAEMVRQNGSASIADDMVQKLFASDSSQNCPDEFELIRNVISKSDRESVAQAQLAMAKRMDFTDLLPKIRLPSLFVVGEHDSITPVGEMRGMAEQVEKSEFAIVPNAGHLPPLENPAEFNPIVLEFLKRFDSGD